MAGRIGSIDKGKFADLIACRATRWPAVTTLQRSFVMKARSSAMIDDGEPDRWEKRQPTVTKRSEDNFDGLRAAFGTIA
jgi:hypothetical protein